MKIRVNDKEEDIPENMSLVDLFGMLKIDKSKALLSVNDDVISDDEYSKRYCRENDNIDIFSFVGGG
jgi:thiamine biosynthesis protein ThiS